MVGDLGGGLLLGDRARGAGAQRGAPDGFSIAGDAQPALAVRAAVIREGVGAGLAGVVARHGLGDGEVADLRGVGVDERQGNDASGLGDRDRLGGFGLQIVAGDAGRRLVLGHLARRSEFGLDSGLDGPAVALDLDLAGLPVGALVGEGELFGGYVRAGAGLGHGEGTELLAHGVGQLDGGRLPVLDGEGVLDLATHLELRSAPCDPGHGRRRRGRVLAQLDRGSLGEGRGREIRFLPCNHGEVDRAARPGGVHSPRSLPSLVGFHGRSAGKRVLDLDGELRSLGDLAGALALQELGHVEGSETGFHLDVDGEGVRVVALEPGCAFGSREGRLIDVLEAGLDEAVVRRGPGQVGNPVVRIRRPRSGGRNRRGVPPLGHGQVEVAVLGGPVLARGRGQDDVPVLGLGGAGAYRQLVVLEIVDEGLARSEDVRERDARARLAVELRRLARLAQRLGGVVRAEVDPPVDEVRLRVDVSTHLVESAGRVRGFRPLLYPAARNVDADGAAVDGDGGLAGAHRLGDAQQSGGAAVESGEALPAELVDFAVERADDVLLGQVAFADHNLRAVVVDLELPRVGVFEVLEDLGELDCEGIARGEGGVAGIPVECELGDVASVQRGFQFVAVGVGFGELEIGDGHLAGRVCGSDEADQRKERGEQDGHDGRRSATPGNDAGGHSIPFIRVKYGAGTP